MNCVDGLCTGGQLGHAHLFLHFDKSSHHALVLHSLSIHFGAFANDLVNSRVLKKTFSQMG